MKRLALTALVLSAAGCTQLQQATRTETETPWLTAPHKYECTQSDIARVHEETRECKAQTEHQGVYCYGAAVIRNCDEPIDYGGDNDND